jgi:hypothetical protein
MSLLNFRISDRLYGGFGALVLFGVGLAGFAVWQLSEIGTQVGTMTVQSANTIRAGEISLQFHAIRPPSCAIPSIRTSPRWRKPTNG